jgi:hypothetical protein
MKRARDGEYIKAFSQLLLVDAMDESRAAKGACSAFLAGSFVNAHHGQRSNLHMFISHDDLC